MTDEEMADKYAFENRESCMYDDRIGWETDHVARKQTFLAGLKAGKDMAETDLATVAYMQGAERYRPKWHKVADGDLPPKDTDVLALLADNEIYMAHFYRRNVWDKIGPVVAWCEIPQYEEE